jgi:hypothetical protein
MKGLVARDMWDMNEYYRIVNEDDIVIREGTGGYFRQSPGIMPC